MNLRQGLWQQQSLKLSMTQELSQAIALLQYSVQELTAFLETKAAENPLLQVEFSNVRSMDPRYDKGRKLSKKTEKDRENWIEQLGEHKVTLEDHLLSQLSFGQITDQENKIIKDLIEHIDENGYLHGTTNEMANRLNISEVEVEEAISILQDLEPAGIGARNLQECLLLQLKKQMPDHETAFTILSEHFTLFAEKKWKELAKLLKINIKEIQKLFDEIQCFNPRPGSLFYHEKPSYVVPDVVVDWDGHEFLISVFDESIPKVSFNEEYFKQLSSYKDVEVSKFLQEKQQDFHWLLKSLEQRKETLTKVTLKIVEKQREFFSKGPGHLKPLTMREISEDLGIHESTVSRAVREKFVQTPFGTYELKSFFSSALQTTACEETSSAEAKLAISRLIETENKQKPLSDQEIAKVLEEQEGIVISRRTVAKYRDQLGILSSSKRKRYD